MRRVNLFSLDAQWDDSDPEGYRAGATRLGPALGASKLGGTVYELPSGQSICPYHYEYGHEEWALVLKGRLTLRHPEGEADLEPGDVVCFPEGPDGAHKLTNNSAEQARVLLLSTKSTPAVVVYPDSDKIGVRPGGERDNVTVRRESSVDYWDREAER